MGLIESKIVLRYKNCLNLRNTITNQSVDPDTKLCKRRLSLFLPNLLNSVRNLYGICTETLKMVLILKILLKTRLQTLISSFFRQSVSYNVLVDYFYLRPLGQCQLYDSSPAPSCSPYSLAAAVPIHQLMTKLYKACYQSLRSGCFVG